MLPQRYAKERYLALMAAINHKLQSLLDGPEIVHGPMGSLSLCHTSVAQELAPKAPQDPKLSGSGCSRLREKGKGLFKKEAFQVNCMNRIPSILYYEDISALPKEVILRMCLHPVVTGKTCLINTPEPPVAKKRLSPAKGGPVESLSKFIIFMLSAASSCMNETRSFKHWLEKWVEALDQLKRSCLCFVLWKRLTKGKVIAAIG